ncbi:Uncharacterised protein [Slackia heliotrinireducens]|uniref:Relaxase/mobilisation nuclease n=1 Tax=Slackia heliotrinireducens (strain ATCC 29202 / DSM 20476 / NCTC 11029 / RHS 1) TaxID=471855 RepID=C7N832_SLAHD|nr:relaxase/mobilization nuclease domain-containing protein [Slackia heliotrinireducens]ACV23067.1 relaxase/mobilisation nuclease [Slackia heliotrinireducens DSM 20476]VEH02025.1 Uncharacterised protein [Slackia heliotrinireducens]
MPTTWTQTTKSAGASIGYYELGRGEKRRKHKAAGTDRALWWYDTFGDREAFVTYCELSKANRKGVEAVVYRFSWSADELPPEDPRSYDAAGFFIEAFIEENCPGHPFDITIHNDGESGLVHGHAAVANRSLLDDTLLTTKKQATRWSMVRSASDNLARERGMQVVTDRRPSWENEREKHQSAYDKQRAKLDAGEIDKPGKTMLEAQRALVIGDAVNALYQAGGFSTTDEWLQLCRDNGIEVEVTEVDGAEGWTYKMHVSDDGDAYRKRGGGKPRMRSRKASNLSCDFTKAGIEARIAELQAQQMQQASAALVAEQDRRREELERRQEQVERQMQAAEERHVVPALAEAFEREWDDGRYARVTRRDVERAVLAVDNELAIMAKTDAADPDLLWRLHEECVDVAHGEMPRAKRNAPHVDVEQYLAQQYDTEAKSELDEVRGMGYRHALRDAPASQAAFERLADRAAKLAEADAKVDNARGFVRSCVALAVYGWRVFQVARAREELLERLGQEGVVGSTTGDMPMFGELRDIVTNGVASWASGLGQQRQAGEAVAYEVDGPEAGVEREEREME